MQLVSLTFRCQLLKVYFLRMEVKVFSLLKQDNSQRTVGYYASAGNLCFVVTISPLLDISGVVTAYYSSTQPCLTWIHINTFPLKWSFVLSASDHTPLFWSWTSALQVLRLQQCRGRGRNMKWNKWKCQTQWIPPGYLYMHETSANTTALLPMVCARRASASPFLRVQSRKS